MVLLYELVPRVLSIGIILLLSEQHMPVKCLTQSSRISRQLITVSHQLHLDSCYLSLNSFVTTSPCLDHSAVKILLFCVCSVLNFRQACTISERISRQLITVSRQLHHSSCYLSLSSFLLLAIHISDALQSSLYSFSLPQR